MFLSRLAETRLRTCGARSKVSRPRLSRPSSGWWSTMARRMRRRRFLKNTSESCPICESCSVRIVDGAPSTIRTLHDSQIGQLSLVFFKNLRRLIRRAIVDHHPELGRDSLGRDTFERAPHVRSLVSARRDKNISALSVHSPVGPLVDRYELEFS